MGERTKVRSNKVRIYLKAGFAYMISTVDIYVYICSRFAETKQRIHFLIRPESVADVRICAAGVVRTIYSTNIDAVEDVNYT